MSTVNTLWSFGDSWGAGWGLAEHEHNYSTQLATKLNMNLRNLSGAGSSLGEITHRFMTNSDRISHDDMVLVTVPPDTRWYRTRGDRDQLQAVFSTQPEYETFLNFINGNIYWFTWHHSLFLSAIYHHAQHIGCKLVFQHNYGELNVIPQLSYVLDGFADAEHSMTHWLTGSDGYHINLEEDHHCGPLYRSFRNSRYFLHKDTHPNHLGHLLIAEKLYTLITKRYTL